MPRLRAIADLSRYRGRKRVLSRPKSAAGKAPDYVTFTAVEKKTVTKGGKKVNVAAGSREIYPEPATLAERNVCAMGKGKVGLRGCHVELVLLGTKHAPAAGKKPGAYLRFCTAPNQKDAPLVRVTNHSQALEMSRAFCACKKTKDAAACVPKNGLDGARARRR